LFAPVRESATSHSPSLVGANRCVRILNKRLLDAANGIRAWIDQLGGAILVRCHDAGAEMHSTVRQGRAVFHDQDAFASQEGRFIDRNGHDRIDDDGLRIEGVNVLPHRLNLGSVGRVQFREDQHIGTQEIDLARKVGPFMPSSMWINEHDLQVRDEERHIVITAVPQENIRVRFGQAKNLRVIDAGSPLDLDPNRCDFSISTSGT
jgi:hypothetical protein